LRTLLKLYIFGLLLITSQQIYGQSGFRSEGEMKSKAAEYFSKDQFILAFPLYSQLLSLDPKNAELNYRFGVCLMYTDRSDTEAPIKYLEKAINKVTDIAFYYHLAVAYQNNYFFTDAIYNYRKYLQLARNKARKDYEVSRKIAMCQNGMNMMKAADDLYVMQKSEVERKAFYRSYELVDFGGRFLNLPEEFLSKADLKNSEEKVTYFNPKAKLLFYALTNKNQKDIYYRIRQNDGDWSEGFLLNATINTTYDEDYPFLMPDGKTLYFSSKGHNTMGGYDIFRTVYDSISRQWSTPSNLSFPFNTPSDDILFISDANETMAWFASNRNSLNNKITVYKVGIIKKEDQSEDLSGIYDGDKLSGNDLGKIKNMALLDINISDKEFREIPVDQKQKLEALKKNDASRISQNIRQTNLINIDKQIEMQEMQTGLNDSIKIVIHQIDTKLEALKSLYIQTQDLVTKKAGQIQEGYSQLSLLLGKAQKTTDTEQKKELLDQANKMLFSTLHQDIQHNTLSNIVTAIDEQINAQRKLLSRANMVFGDIQKNIITRNEVESKKNIALLDILILSADTLTDYTKIIDYSTGNLFYPNYPSNLLDEKTFVAYYLENEREYRSPISTIETRYSAYIPEISKISELDFLKDVEEKTSTARQKNKQLIYQLKLVESLINEKKKATNLLLKEANALAQAFNSKSSSSDLAAINSKFAEARRAAFETHLAQQTYSSLKTTTAQSEKIAGELSTLKSRIELLVEKGKNQEALNLKARVEELENQNLHLPNYDDSIDFKAKKLKNVNYPTAIKSINSYVEYSIQNGKLEKRAGQAFSSRNVDELISNSNLLQTETAQPQKEESIGTTIGANLSQDEIRKELAALKKQQTNRLEKLRQQSALLTKKSGEKLDASNAALLDFEMMREKYNKGELNDKKSILAKQTESQNLLYQSLAIKNFAEKTDSLIQVEQKQKEESTDQIFAIEQALLANQPEKAQALFRALHKTTTLPNEQVESLVQTWISKGVENIPNQKDKANLAFENAQKLTDESIQLLMESQELREEAKNKTNAFKRRELIREAETKEALGIQKQDKADKQLALGTSLYDLIKRAEAIKPIAKEFTASSMLATNSKPVLNPEKRKVELKERLDTREKETKTTETSEALFAQKEGPKLNLENIPEMNDLIAYETKRYKAQLLAEDLDINKRETVHLLKTGKTLRGEEAVKNSKQVAKLRKEADSLQKASSQAFIQAQNIYQQLPSTDKKKADKSKNNFENYLRNVKNRIAQLLDDVTLLSEQASTTEDEASREDLIRQADEKEQIAMYLILEEYEIIAQRNKQNYRKNSLAINKLFLENLSQKEKELMQAIFSQIEQFMFRAENKRIKAQDPELTFALKKMLHQDAYSLESSALDLQLEAIRMMRENDTESMLAYQPKKKPATQTETLAIKENIPETTQNNTSTQTKEEASLPQIKVEESPIAFEEVEKQRETEVKVEEPPITIIEEEKPEEILKQERPKTTVVRVAPETEVLAKVDQVITEKQAEEDKTITKDPEQRLSLDENKKEVETNAKNKVSTPVVKTTKTPKVFQNVSLDKEPSGTQFSVQIAAIGGIRTIDNFLNVIELFALKDSEKELYRYFSGRFTNLKAAIIRRNSLRMQGYSDAFIKSWKDGQNVSMFEAAGEIDEATTALLNKTTIALPSQFKNVNFSATNISQLNGVYYSVQVGVYSRPRSSVQLFGISPLYHNRMNNGYWVYFNGIYKSISDAEENKTSVREKGVPDAFVVAFNEGEKVSLTNARKAISQGNALPADEDIIILEDAAIEVDNQLKTIIRPQKTRAKSLVYKIQIGVFTHQISMDWVLEKLDKSDQKINHFVSSTGKHVYTIGSFTTYAEAASFNTNEVKKLIKDAFIVSFENGTKKAIAK